MTNVTCENETDIDPCSPATLSDLDTDKGDTDPLDWGRWRSFSYKKNINNYRINNSSKSSKTFSSLIYVPVITALAVQKMNSNLNTQSFLNNLFWNHYKAKSWSLPKFV